MVAKEGKQKIFIKTLEQAGFIDCEIRSFKIQDMVVFVFSSSELYLHVSADFIYKVLIPKNRKDEKARKLFVIKMGPSRDADDMLCESLGFKEKPANEEVWLLIKKSELSQFYEHLVGEYAGNNPNVEIVDVR